MKLGAQFYTLRSFCKTTEGLSDALARVAAIGYTTIQLSGVCDYDPEWMAEELRKNSLSCALTHTNPDRILGETDRVCRDHKLFGCTNVGIGSMPGGNFSPEAYAEFVKNFLPAARKMKDRGCKLHYHNHHQEFSRTESGALILEKLLDDFPADLLGITFDTYWAQCGGADSAEWIKCLSGRIDCLHLKDMAIVGKEQRMAAVGKGNMNFGAILRAAEDTRIKYLLVEQDNCYEEDPFDCLKQSYDYLKSFGLK